jgi:uncharacterized protein YecE (DUF72 family)
MKILAGTSGFAFKEWKGPFYPEKLKDTEMLAFYSGKFPVVEINNTFYQLPKAKTLLDWADRVPESFQFAIKASQRITHFARLKPESADVVEYLLKTVSVLGDRLGPMLFQLPPNMKRDDERLAGFLARLPRGRKYAVEFRHESWFDHPTFERLRENDVAFVVSEQEDFASPVLATASWTYVRPHRLDYGAEHFAAWAARLQSLERDTNYVFFKHDHVPEGGAGPLAVDSFLKACAARSSRAPS